MEAELGQGGEGVWEGLVVLLLLDLGCALVLVGRGHGDLDLGVAGESVHGPEGLVGAGGEPRGQLPHGGVQLHAGLRHCRPHHAREI